MIAHANSANTQIVSLSADIALTQHGQIGYMQAWLRDWRLSPTGSRPAMSWMPNSDGALVNGLMPGMATPDQMSRLRSATGTDLDVQFLTLMRQHHLGGIHMAQAILEESDNKDVTWLAGTIVTSQQGEINLIDSMLKEMDVVRVSKGPHEFRLVTLPTMNFYEAFRTKFNFRIRPDAVPTRRQLGGAALPPS